MMTPFATDPRRVFCIAAPPLIVLLLSGTAQAALTADQVWQSWKDAAGLADLTVSAATEARDGASLMLNGVTIAPAGAAGLTISDMVLTEQSDGSVLITPGADIGMDLAGPGSDSASLDIMHQGLTITARDAAGALVYDYAAAALNVDFNASHATAGTASEGVVIQGSSLGKVMFEGLEGTYSDTPGINRTFGLTLGAARLAYEVSSDSPDIPLKTATSSDTADVALQFDVVMPQTVSLMALQSVSEFQKALQEGFSVSGGMQQGVSTAVSAQESEFAPYQMSVTTQPGESTFGFDKDQFVVDGSSAALAIGFSSAMMPVPLQVTSGPLRFLMKSPVMAGEAAGDYALIMQLRQLSVNEEAWAMLDPGGVLTREPADLSIDLSGKARIDFLAMAAAEEAGAMPPVPAPETLDITDLTLKIAGAAFGATGAFTFDNTMGMPMPLGEANVSLTGGNALIDGLIATGMITADDAMGARMMMGMFFAPGDVPDSLTSRIEARPGNEIWVNGQRIQ